MRIPIKKLAGLLILILFMGIYAFTVMIVAIGFLHDKPHWMHMIYYMFAGCLWAFPAMLILNIFFKRKSDVDGA